MPRPREEVAPATFWFNLVNCSSGAYLTDPHIDTDDTEPEDEDDGAATDVSQLQVAVQRPASDDLQSQLWCWLTDGRLYSAAGNSAVVSVHKRAGSPVLVQRGSHEIKGVLTKWCIGGDGAISCDGGDVVMDGKASGVASESADVGIRPRRSFAPSSQRWIAVPQPAPDLDPDVPGPAVCTFKLISTSGKALDTCADGRLSTFDPHPGSKTQRWRFLCGPHGLYLDNAHTDEVATLHWAESANPDGDAHLSQVRISARTPALYDRQLWSFDTKGFLVSRHSGWVLESLSLQEGGAVAATTRRTSVAGLGLFFKNFSTDSQIWHVVPADPLGGIHRPRSRPKSEDKEESRDVYSSEFLDAALAELDEFGADLDESRSMSPNGCDEALEALDRMSTELNRRDNLDDSEGEAGSAIASPPPSPRATPPSLDRNATADELWVKLARPAFQNTALKQITEHVWLLFEEDFTGRLTGDLLKPKLESSGLPNEQLLEIWSLVDTTNVGSVSFSQLLVLMALLAQAQRGDTPNYTKLDLTCASPPHMDGVDIHYKEVWM